MVPRAGGELLGELFGVGNVADELLTDFSPIVELSPVEHLKAGDTDSATCGGDSGFSDFFPPWVSGDSGQGVKIIDHKVEVGFGVISGIGHDGLDLEGEMLKELFE